MARATAALAELEPRTPAEAMLAAQMVATHRLAMNFLMRLGLQDQSPYGRDSNIQRASRLMRLFIQQLGAMAKLKGHTGQQRVVVEHVTVANGGQAIVGAITRGEPA